MKTTIKIMLFVLLAHFSSIFLFAAEQEKIRDVFETNVPTAETRKPSGFDQTPAVRAELGGMGIGPSGAFAIINGQVYREGEEKQGIKVAQIRKQEVDIVVNGMLNTLRLIPQENLKGSAPEPDSELDESESETEFESSEPEEKTL